MFYFFDELTSTIDEARDLGYGHGDVVVAEFQTAGRGQRGRVWSSAAGENLMLSVVLDTSFLRATEQFLLLQTVALSLVDVLAGYGLEARVKWTNDIYIGDRKVVGVLIDHTLGPDGMLARSGVGVGVNVCQRIFDPSLPNPTSMALELERLGLEGGSRGGTLDRREVLERFHGRLMERVEELRAACTASDFGSPHPPTGGADDFRRKSQLQAEYHSKIYRLDTPAEFELPDGERFTGTIRGVAPLGELLVEHPDGTVRGYLYREIAFII